MPKRTDREKEVFLHVNYAHRGLHSADKSVPENSLAAFRAARDMGYGYELDVQFSKDSQVVVFHDDTLDRVTGVHGRVEDFTYEELLKMPLCGTEERIPLFTDVLSLIDGEGGPLIVELKMGRRNDELCAATYEILKNYKGVYCIESFHPMIVNWFRKNAPEVFRGQLATQYEYVRKEGKSPILSYILSHCLFSALNKPDFIAYHIGKRPENILRMQKKGILLFGWTPHDPSPEKDNDGMIFEFYRPGTKYE